MLRALGHDLKNLAAAATGSAVDAAAV